MQNNEILTAESILKNLKIMGPIDYLINTQSEVYLENSVNSDLSKEERDQRLVVWKQINDTLREAKKYFENIKTEALKSN